MRLRNQLRTRKLQIDQLSLELFMKKYSSDLLLSCPFEISILGDVMKKIKIELELSAAAVKKIEDLNGVSLKPLLESEINENVDVFIEMMGYDNY